MTKRRVLIISYYFPPSATSAVHRLSGFTRHLPTHGWRCSVVAAPVMPGDPVDPALTARVGDDTDVFPAPFPSRMRVFTSRWAPRAAWLPGGFRATWRAVKATSPDVLVTSGPPHWVHLVGMQVASRSGLPWVADLRDPWVAGAPIGGLPTRGRLAARVQRRLEREVMSRADGVIANTPGAARVIGDTYPEVIERLHVIRNGFDAEDYDSLVRNPGSHFVHAGQITGRRDPGSLLDALKLCDPPPRLRLLGLKRGWPHDLVRDVGSRSLDDTVEIAGHQPFRATCQEIVDAAVLVLVDSPGRRVGVPAKLYEYLGARRPILAITEPDSETAETLAGTDVAHVCATPGDSTAIAAAVQVLSNRNPRDLEPSAPRTLERMANTASLAALLDSLLDPRPAAGEPDSARPSPSGTDS